MRNMYTMKDSNIDKVCEGYDSRNVEITRGDYHIAHTNTDVCSG